LNPGAKVRGEEAAVSEREKRRGKKRRQKKNNVVRAKCPWGVGSLPACLSFSSSYPLPV